MKPEMNIEQSTEILKALNEEYKIGYERGHDIGYNEGYVAGIAWCNQQIREKLLNHERS